MCLVTMFTSCQKKTEGSITVTTKTVTDITENSAKCGGSVTSTGYSVGNCGVCYGESHNPIIDDSFTKDREGTGSFTSTLSNLKSSTTYYVRAYAKTSSGVEYGDEKTFKTLGNGGGNGGGGGSGNGYTINVFANPTAGGTVTGAGTYQVGQSCTVTAIANTESGYTFTNWTEDNEIASSNANYAFTVTGSRNLVANFERLFNGQSYVDLGLPSGILWATCNVGATTPEGYGDYFAWGETANKSTYDWNNYAHCHGGKDQLTKYCSFTDYGYNGYTDTLTVLQSIDDAASANLGNGWRMPTNVEWFELENNTTSIWTKQSGVNGRLFTASNGSTLFLPAIGRIVSDGSIGIGSSGLYWSSTLFAGDYPIEAWSYYFNSDDAHTDLYSRCIGCAVRAVNSARQ